MTERNLCPSTSGSVVLDLGPHAGALVLHVQPELDGQEIDISLVGGAGEHRTHSLVRQRHVGGQVRYAAVYPDLPPGEYVVWRNALTPALGVAVRAGTVTTASWL